MATVLKKGSPTVVQTSGSSTVDVMSQDSVTKAIANIAAANTVLRIPFTQFSDTLAVPFTARFSISSIAVLRDIGSLRVQLFYNNASLPVRVAADTAPATLAALVSQLNADVVTAQNQGFGAAITVEISALITTGKSRGEVVLTTVAA